jgi:hypothetical protein
MSNYRVYCYAGGGRLWADDQLEAGDDDQAITSARAMKDVIEAEVWQGHRLVARVEPAKPQQARSWVSALSDLSRSLRY